MLEADYGGNISLEGSRLLYRKTAEAAYQRAWRRKM